MQNNGFLNAFSKIEPINKGWSEDKKYCVTKADGTKYLLRVTPAETVLPLMTEAEQYELGLKSGKILRKIHSVAAPDTQENWAVPFGQSEIDTMMKQSQNVLAWYDNMNNLVPAWYQRDN